MCPNLKKKNVKKGKSVIFGTKKKKTGVSLREEKSERERKGKRGFSLLSKIYENRAVGFRRSGKKS